MKEFFINENDAGQRLDSFLQKACVSLPKSLMYKAIRTKKIKVNRKRCEIGQILRPGDTVLCFLPPEFFQETRERWLDLTPTLSVVYEDDRLLVCDKPVGQSCHSDEVQKTGTLIDHIKAYLAQKGEFCPEKENSFAPALCNRIDRNTSGLVICAKNAVALREMNALIKARLPEKYYLAWVHGHWQEHRTVTLYLKKCSEENRVLVSSRKREGFLDAVTEIRPLRRDAESDRTLVEIRLHTGRTHQIRATMAHLGYPLLGDSKYGTDSRNPLFAHQALRSHRLVLHTGENSPLRDLEGLSLTAPQDPKFS